ncbi:MAG: phage holin family protein [Campylobacter sp.]
MDLLDRAGIYLWVFMIGLIGGALGFIGNSSTKKRIIDAVIGTFTSMFLGWIGYEIVNAWSKDERIALASCGFIAWRGAEWIRQIVDNFIKNKIINQKDESEEQE